MQTLAANGIAAAETRLIEDGGRLFLESRRFDRIGEHGRTSMIALAAIDAEFVGKGSSWPRVFEALHQRGLLRPRQVVEAETLWCFGKLVHNTDMHLGNLSLAIDGDMFSLLPAYDMCSMGFAPRSGGEVLPYALSLTHPERVALSDEEYRLVLEMAVNFWDRVASDDRISSQFKEFLATGNPVKMLG
jgi:serine/threonine protein kinase HipA of HipAB toxin-antitoxin module